MTGKLYYLHRHSPPGVSYQQTKDNFVIDLARIATEIVERSPGDLMIVAGIKAYAVLSTFNQYHKDEKGGTHFLGIGSLYVNPMMPADELAIYSESGEDATKVKVVL